MRKYIHILFATFLVIFISGCINQSVVETPEKKAVSIRNAINTNNLALLANSISLPLVISKQGWKTADDGHGFVLGSKNTLVAKNSEELDGIFSILKNVAIEGDYPLKRGFNLIDFTDEFSGVEQYWEPLELVVFFRGQGDVEHIVVLGLEKKSLKLRAIYIN